MACVLVIDEYEPFRQTMEFCLPRFGHAVLTAGDVRTAIRLGAGHAVDVVLLDLGGRGMPGLAVCRELKREANFRRVPIVLMTVDPTAEAQVPAGAAGAAAIVAKPFRWPELLAILARQLPQEASAGRPGA